MRSADQTELVVVNRALQRTAQLRQDELHAQARLIRNELGELLEPVFKALFRRR